MEKVSFEFRVKKLGIMDGDSGDDWRELYVNRPQL